MPRIITKKDWKLPPARCYNLIGIHKSSAPAKRLEEMPSLHLGAYNFLWLAKLNAFIFNLMFRTGGLYVVHVIKIDPFLMAGKQLKNTVVVNDNIKKVK